MAATDAAGKRLPLKRRSGEKIFWVKLVALWHRERMRAVYKTTGHSRADSRHRANREAMELANRNGWAVKLPEFKAGLAEFVVQDLASRGRPARGRGIRFWEEQAQLDLLALLREPPPRIRKKLERYLRNEAKRNGRFEGREGFYRMTHIASYVPTMDHLEQRNAFIAAMSEIGCDGDYCDRELYKCVMQLYHEFSHRPFETRLGFSMPGAEAPVGRLRGWLQRLRPQSRV